MNEKRTTVITLARPALASLCRCSAGALLLFAAGCVSTRRPPPDLAHVEIARVHSPLVEVSRAWFERKEGCILVRGHVLRRPETKDTTRTHLDLAWLDANGTVLRTTTGHFEPRQIPRRPRMPDSSDFTLAVDAWPSETRTLILRAHEGDHP